MRLVLPRHYTGLRIWDTPSPPPLELCEFFGPPPASGYLRSLEFSKLTAFTFFCLGGHIFGVHGHMKDRPTASEEHFLLQQKRPQNYVWIYIPLKGVCTIGLTGPSSLIFQWDKTVLHVGRSTAGSARIAGELPKDLIFEETHPGEAIRRIGLHTQTACTTRTMSLSRSSLYQSGASLDDVQTVHVYYDNDQLLPKGVLFTYNQGTEQAIGQCKIGITQETRITAPDYLLYEKTDGGFKLLFAADKPAADCETLWTCTNMAGMLMIRFDSDSIIDLIVQ